MRNGDKKGRKIGRRRLVVRYKLKSTAIERVQKRFFCLYEENGRAGLEKNEQISELPAPSLGGSGKWGIKNGRSRLKNE